MLKSLDRIKELTSTTGTGTLTLTGAESGFQAFSVLGNGTKCYYTITDVNTTDFEVGEGTYNSNTLTRDTIFESSNSGNAISLSATGSTVFVTYPAEKSSYRDIGVNRDYTASGSITAGKPLILNADNTVSQIAETSITFGLGTVQEIDSSSGNSDYFNIYDSYRNKVLAIYRKGSGSNNLVYRVGTINTSANTITYSSEANITTGGMHSLFAVYDEVQQATIVFYNDNTAGEGRANVITLDSSGNGTVSSAQTFNSNNTGEVSAVYTGSSKTVISYENSSTQKSRVVSLSGTTLSFGTVADVINSTPNNTCIGYDPDQQKVLIVHRDAGNSYYVTEELGTISGTDITYTSSVKISASSPYPDNERAMTYDEENKKLLLNLYSSNTNQIYVITVSGSSTTWGSANQYSTTSNEATISYNATSKSTLLGYRNTSNNYPIARSVTLNGSTVSFGTETQVSTTNANGNDIATASAGAKSIVSYVDNSNNNYDGAVVTMPSTSTNLTNDNYFGIASSTASDTEVVGVNRAGSFNNDQTGLTAGKDYYAKDDGTIVERTTTTTTPDTNPTISTITTQAGSTYSYWDNSIAYESTSGYYVRGRRDGSTNYPVVESGTWGSLSAGITWNTPTVLSSNSLRGQRVRVATGGGYAHCSYCTRESSNENAKVTPVAISGSGGLTLGTTTTVNTLATSGSNTQPTSIVYDTSQNTILAFFDLGWQSGYLHKVFPLQMSGANYSYSSTDAVTFASGIDMSAKSTNAIYDPDTNRTVFFYILDAGTRTVNGIVFSCSGTTITQGSTQTASFTGTPNSNGYLTLAYDTQNNKIIIMYDVNLGAPSYLSYLPKYSIVTVTGGGTNTLSYTADAYAFSDTTQRTQVVSLAWNGDANKLFMVYGAYGDSHIQCDIFTSNGSTLTSISSEELTTNGVVDSGSNETNASVFVTGQGVSYSLGGADSSPSILNFTLSLGSTTSTTINASQFVGTARSGTDLELAEPPTELVGTANGAITKGKPVILRTDGDFEEVSGTSTSVTYSAGSETEVQAGSGNIQYANITYDINEDKYLSVYKDEGDGYGYANVLSTSGTTLSVGSKSSNFSGSANMNIIDSVYDEESGNHVIFYYNGVNQYGYAVVASISGTSVTFGTPVAFNSANTYYRGTCFYDSTNKKVVWVGGEFNGSAYTLKAIIGTVSGTSISFGTISDSGVTSSNYYSSAYDKNSSVGVVSYRDSSAHGNIRTISISGTSITWNTAIVFQASNTTMSADSMTYDETNQKIVLFFKDSSDNVQGIVGTVSGTTISMGTAVDSTYNNGSNTFACVWTKQGVVALINRDDSSPYYLHYLQATVSGTSLSYAGATTLNSQAVSVDATGVSIAYNSATYNVVPFYVENATKDAQALVVYPAGSISSSNLTSNNFIGFAENTVADNEDVKVKVISQSDENQTGLTTASQYYVQNDGTLSTTAGDPSVLGGTALSSTKILIKS
jgi:hypothetical protein